MKCDEVKDRLEDYQYGELEKTSAEHVAAHLRRCAACASAFAALEKESRIYELFAEARGRALEVDPRIWQGISAHLTDSAGAPGKATGSMAYFLRALDPLRRPALAATLGVLLIAGGLVTIWVHKESRPEVSRRASFEDAMAAIQRAEKEYIEAIRILSAITEQRRASLDPRLAREVEQNLRVIDQAIASTRSAYKARPNDPELALYMLRAYARKVELLQELAS